MSFVRTVLFVIAACTVVVAALAGPSAAQAQGAQAAQGVVMVVDRTGTVTLAGTGAPAPVATLATLPVGSRLQLDAAARITLLYTASADEYIVAGPGAAQVDAAGVTATGGATVQRRASGPAKPLQLRADAVTMGGVVVRSAGVRTRSPEGVLTVRPARLAWSALASRANYRVELRDAAGALVFQRSVQGLSLAFPPEVHLQPAEHYTWTVMPDPDTGPIRSAAVSTNFHFASKEVLDQAHRHAPGADADFADRVVYALWLEQIGAQGEARERWQALSDQRPGDDALLARALR